MSDFEQEIFAEPLPGTVTQGRLVFLKNFSELSSSGMGMPIGNRVLRARGTGEWVASIFAAVRMSSKEP